jgi:hypothetical protein
MIAHFNKTDLNFHENLLNIYRKNYQEQNAQLNQSEEDTQQIIQDLIEFKNE